MLPTYPCENGGSISWITTRFPEARSITSKSEAAIATQSPLGAAATISDGASAGFGAGVAAAAAARIMSVFMEPNLAHPPPPV
jgi:hypothetical protein